MNTENAPGPVQTGHAVFIPRARLLRLIGSELISDDVVAIMELVKNAHDADASFVSIQFSGVTGEDGEILVRDDGHGMNLDTLLGRWMQPAGSAKGREGNRHTAKGRRLLGEKGVGRFAADKLAASLELVSRCAGENNELHAVFDWDEFDADEKMLSDVRSRWELRPADWLDGNGTLLRLTRLRSRWTERMFRRLSTRLSRMISPFVATEGFSIRIESDEFPHYSGEVGGGFLERSPYRIEAEFDGGDHVTLRIDEGRPARHSLAGHDKLICGPVRARFFAFDLETEALARIGPRLEVRAWLREWSGVSLYRDGFRLWPYGEPHDDWLRLDQRRVNNPVLRLSNNQIVGFVEITADRNKDLKDQTSREGIVHNQAFEDLQRFVLFTLQVLESERQARRHPPLPQTSQVRSEVASQPQQLALPETLEKLAKRAPGAVGADIRQAATEARTRMASEDAKSRRMLDGYSELAAFGQLAGLFARSAVQRIEALQTACSELRGLLAASGKHDRGKAGKLIAHLEQELYLVTRQMADVAAPAPPLSKRRRGLDVQGEVSKMITLIEPLLQKHQGIVEFSADETSVLRVEMRQEAFQALMSVLLNNSLEWKADSHPLRVTIAIRQSEDVIEITFSDNGKGILPGLEGNIFEPMISGRSDGAGMGLTIARQIVTDHGGSIELVTDRRRRGAMFLVTLPRKKSRSTLGS